MDVIHDYYKKQHKQLDSYSLLIVSKYFIFKQDYINIICTCKKFRETTEKLRYNPIPIKSLKLFPKIQTQFLYSLLDKRLEGIKNIEICYEQDYEGYLTFKKKRIKCHHVKYTSQNRKRYGESIPDGVTVLGKKCYKACNMITLIIPNSVTTIKSDCFSWNDSLQFITLPNGLTRISSCCFSLCSSLQSIIIPSSIQILDDACFSNCSSLTSITIPNSVTSIGMTSFYECTSLQTITIPNSVTSIGNCCFRQCDSLVSIKLPTTLMKLDFDTFGFCSSLKNVVFPLTLTSIGDNCFRECFNLTTLTMPLTLKEIGSACFYKCSNLKSIELKESVRIGLNCFEGCKKLQTQPNASKKNSNHTTKHYKKHTKKKNKKPNSYKD